MTANMLDAETSPYLLQHKDNPVHWRAWSPDVLAEARSSPIRRTKHAGLKRNAAIVLGNLGDSAARSALLRAEAHTDPVVAETARWALERI